MTIKRKHQFEDIIITLPSRKKVKIHKLSIETTQKMDLRTEEELSKVFYKSQKYPGNQQQYFEREEQKKRFERSFHMEDLELSDNDSNESFESIENNLNNDSDDETIVGSDLENEDRNE